MNKFVNLFLLVLLVQPIRAEQGDVNINVQTTTPVGARYQIV